MITPTSPKLIKCTVRDAWTYAVPTYVAEQLGFMDRTVNFTAAQKGLALLSKSRRAMATLFLVLGSLDTR